MSTQLFDEPVALLLVVTGVPTLAGGTGLQVVWLLMLVVASASVALHGRGFGVMAQRAPEHNDQNPPTS